MTFSFTKLVSSLPDSTIWCEDSDTRVVWITMLAMADRYGRVFASIPGLAGRSRVTLPAVEVALAKFLAPDKYSRNKEAEGRRIEEIDGGWHLLSYEFYRNLRDDESAKEAKRNWWRRNRGKDARLEPLLDGLEQTRTDSNQAEAEAEAEADKYKDKETVASLPAWFPMESWIAFVEMRQRNRAPLTPKAQEMILSKLETLVREGEDATAVLNQSTMNSWRGIFPVHKEGKSNGRRRPDKKSLMEAIRDSRQRPHFEGDSEPDESAE